MWVIVQLHVLTLKDWGVAAIDTGCDGICREGAAID